MLTLNVKGMLDWLYVWFNGDRSVISRLMVWFGFGVGVGVFVGVGFVVGVGVGVGVGLGVGIGVGVGVGVGFGSEMGKSYLVYPCKFDVSMFIQMQLPIPRVWHWLRNVTSSATLRRLKA